MSVSKWKQRFIDITSTLQQYGYKSFDEIRSTSKVLVICSKCELPKLETTPASIRKRNGQDFVPICKSCQQKKTWEDDAYRGKIAKSISSSMEKVWTDEAYRDNASTKASLNSTNLWKNDSFRDKISKSLRSKYKEDQTYKSSAIANLNSNSQKRLDSLSKARSRLQYRDKLSEAARRNWSNEEYRSKMLKIMASDDFSAKVSAQIKKKWESPEYAAKVMTNNKSSLEDKLASILDDLKIEYVRQYHLGHWPFDFLIYNNPKDILIEVHGDYWHGTKVDYNRSRDQAKATFIERYHSDRYILKVIWEHEFLASNRIVSILSNILNISNDDIHDFAFKDLDIKSCDNSEANLLLSKYHYSSNGGRSGISIGCYLDDTLIACAKFCNPNRTQSATRLGLDQKNLKELTRLVIHPSYQKRNLASFFLSKALKLVPCDNFITFADSTFGHTGSVYKACGWVLDGIVPPDYFYVDKDGFVMHKRTLWGHAKKMSMSEKDFADKYGYITKYGKEKYRFIYNK